MAPSGGRGRTRNLEVRFCFGYRPPNFGCDNRMNFPTLQSLRSLACSPTRSRRSPLPEGAFWGVRTLQKFPAGATIGRPLVRQRLTSRIRRGGVSPPACRKFYPAFRRRTDEPALCKGRCRAERGGGVVSDKLSSFFPANFTPLQSLRRCRASSLCTREPLGLCKHCKNILLLQGTGLPPHLSGCPPDNSHTRPLRSLITDNLPHPE